MTTGPARTRWGSRRTSGSRRRRRIETPGVDVGDHQVLGELRRRARRRCRSASNTAERPSKTNSSWPPTWLQNTSAALQSEARVASIRSRASPLPACHGDADRHAMTSTPGGGQIAGDRVRVPDVLADREADAHAEQLDDQRAVAGAEVARLVEDAVVGQKALVVDLLDPSVGDDRRRVEAVPVPLHAADQRRPVGDVARDLLEGPLAVAGERGPQQQVLRRIAGQHQLGEHRQVRAGGPGTRKRLERQACVAGDVTDDGVELGESDAHSQRIVDATRSGAPPEKTGALG